MLVIIDVTHKASGITSTYVIEAEYAFIDSILAMADSEHVVNVSYQSKE